MGKVEEIAQIHHEGLLEEFKAVGIDATISHDHLVDMWGKYAHETLTFSQDGKILGFLGLFDGSPMIYVSLKHQREGIGSYLLQNAKIKFVWVMDGNAKAENFYKKHGFNPTESRELTKLGHKITEIKWIRDEE